MPSRVKFSGAAEDLLRKLYAIHRCGFMFHQSGGCCDGSSPMCYQAGEFRVGPSDVLMQVIEVDGLPEPIKFYMSLEQFEYWRHTRLTIDVVPGRGSGFSMESPEGVRFLTRSRLFTDDEAAALATSPVQLGDGSLMR
ncbi:MAG: DUF779 domain-containing protein [Actinomycetales bacterium]|nr:DUF779 domain-containing protein [Actinomycetales bacterium]